MRTKKGQFFAGMIMCFGLSGLIAKAAQDSPLRPLPPMPPTQSVRRLPTLRPHPPVTVAQTNRPALAAAPSVPTPLVQPPPAAVNPFLPPVAPPPPAPQVTNPGALAYDADQKEYSAKPGETMANVTFNLTNLSSSEVLVNRVSTSCGCTVAKLPAQPWRLAPSEGGPINVTVDLRGKGGTIMKTVTVDSTAGVKSLLVKVTIPPPQLAAPAAPMDRGRNMELAKADRQAVFKNDCAECHVKPALGKMGKELYGGACAICHEAEHRATMVPDLHVFKHPDTREYWTYSISEGKVNSLMPAFGLAHGGYLTEQQIASLVDYMTTGFAKDPPASHAVHALSSVPGRPQNPPPNPGAPVTALGPFYIR